MKKVKIILKRLKTSQSCEKSYTDVRRRDLEFRVNHMSIFKGFIYKRCDEIQKEREA